MADEEEDNVFEDEEKIIEYAEREQSSDSDDDSDSQDEVVRLAKKEKTEKKKRKFSEMKEKKSIALSSQSTDVEIDSLDASSQYRLVMKHSIKSKESLDISEECFMSLPSPSSGRKVSKFVTAIDHAVPSRADLLQLPSPALDGCCSPMVLVICSGARRGCEVINILSQNYKCKIAKLFAKHFRIQDQIEILKSTHFPLAVGTPNRLHKLVDMGALSLSQTALIIVDLCEDVKGFNVMSLSDTKCDFFDFLATYCCPEKGHLKIACVHDDPIVNNTNKKRVRQGTNKNFRSKDNKKRVHPSKKRNEVRKLKLGAMALICINVYGR